MRFKYDSKEEARNDYLKQIEYLKYGIIKCPFGDVSQKDIIFVYYLNQLINPYYHL